MEDERRRRSEAAAHAASSAKPGRRRSSHLHASAEAPVDPAKVSGAPLSSVSKSEPGDACMSDETLASRAEILGERDPMKTALFQAEAWARQIEAAEFRGIGDTPRPRAAGRPGAGTCRRAILPA